MNWQSATNGSAATEDVVAPVTAGATPADAEAEAEADADAATENAS